RAMLSRQFTTVPNTSKVRALTSERAIGWDSFHSGRRCYREAADDAVTLDELRDETRFLRFLDKVAQEGGTRGVFPRRADRLLHSSELAAEDARARACPCHLQEPRTQPGIGVHLLTVERFECGVGTVELQQLRLLDVVFEPEAVGAARRYRDALPGLVDLADMADRGARRHEIGRLDLAIGGGEVDHRGALRFGADQANVPQALLVVVGDLARAGIGHILHRHAEAGGDLRSHVGGDTGGVARRAL